MIEDLPKLIELGALGIISITLIFKGIDKMEKLTNSIKELTTMINETKKHFDVVDMQLAALNSRVTALETFIRDEFHNLRLRLNKA